MATSAATIYSMDCGDVEIPSGGQVSLQKVNLSTGSQYGGIDCLPFQGNAVGQGNSQSAIWDFVLPRGVQGFTATTGIKIVVSWFGKKQSQAVAWAASFQLNGQTDLPAPAVENFPVLGSTNEIIAVSNCNTTTYAGLVQVTITLTLANIKNLQTTSPAAGDQVRFRLRRALENAGDTLNDFAYVTMVEAYDY